MRRVLLLLLSLALAATAVCAGTTAYAAVSGVCGDDLTWEYSDHVLTISGSGEMADYSASGETAPWSDFKSVILSVVLENGVTGIGDFAFYKCANLCSVEIPESISQIGKGAFSHCESLGSVRIPFRVSRIVRSAFQGCASLSAVSLPGGLKSIGTNAFSGCEGFRNVVFRGSADLWSVLEISSGNELFQSALRKFEPPLQGDLNEDGTVTSADAIHLLYSTFYPFDYPVNQSCDFNSDGEVSSADAVFLLYHSFYPEDYPFA